MAAARERIGVDGVPTRTDESAPTKPAFKQALELGSVPAGHRVFADTNHGDTLLAGHSDHLLAATTIGEHVDLVVFKSALIKVVPGNLAPMARRGCEQRDPRLVRGAAAFRHVSTLRDREMTEEAWRLTSQV